MRSYAERELDAFKADPFMQLRELSKDEKILREQFYIKPSFLDKVGATLRSVARGGRPDKQYVGLRAETELADTKLNHLTRQSIARFAGHTIASRRGTLHFLPENGVSIVQSESPNYYIKPMSLIDPVFNAYVELKLPVLEEPVVSRLNVLPPVLALHFYGEINDHLEAVLADFERN